MVDFGCSVSSLLLAAVVPSAVLVGWWVGFVANVLLLGT